MDNVHIGIIGGSGLYDMADVTDRTEITLTTPFGDPSGPYVLGTLRRKRVAFLARHGAGHRLLPSELYRILLFLQHLEIGVFLHYLLLKFLLYLHLLLFLVLLL